MSRWISPSPTIFRALEHFERVGDAGQALFGAGDPSRQARRTLEEYQWIERCGVTKERLGFVLYRLSSLGKSALIRARQDRERAAQRKRALAKKS